MPILSVVIPTRNRPELVLRAVRSALSQTFGDIEVLVVLDGPDDLTEASLALVTDSRLRIVRLQEPVGGAEARNRGVEAAFGKWIAFLDDDDEWMAEKLEKQLAVGSTSRHRFPVISSKLIARSPQADYIWPRVEPYLPVGNYLFQRRSLFKGEGVLQTSTLVALRELLRSCPFTKGLRKRQEADWLIRALEVPGAGLEFVPDALTIFYTEEKRSCISAVIDWHYSLDWANRIRPFISPEAYASFLLIFISSEASAQRDWNAFIPLAAAAIKQGSPRPIHLMLFLGMWLVPGQFRRFLRRVFHGAPAARAVLISSAD